VHAFLFALLVEECSGTLKTLGIHPTGHAEIYGTGICFQGDLLLKRFFDGL